MTTEARSPQRQARFAAAFAAGLMLASCGKPSAPGATAQNSAAEAAAVKPTEPFRLADVFPAGRGRDKVLGACGSCHALVCVTRGQRTGERWENIKTSHKDKLTDSSGTDLDEMFSYLKTNFNETKPEPQVPAELLQQGCTPF